MKKNIVTIRLSKYEEHRIMKRRTVVLILCLLAVPFLLSAQESERRTALVIGNADYEISPLQNPVNDARDMAAVLKDLGFEVNTVINGTRREMSTAIRDFGRKLNQYNVGLFYYSGHGIQFEGTNFIVPIDANIQKDLDIEFETVNIGRVLVEMESARNAVNIVMLDACRNNPYVSRFRAINRGLSVVEAPAGSLVVYATAPGDVAAEGRGRNGIFTGALLKHIKTPSIEVREMLTRVRRDVLAATGNEQTPWDSSSLTAGFYFAGAGGRVATTPEAERRPTITVEKAYGSVAVEVRTAGTLYLDGTKQVRIPAGGRARIADLEAGSHSLEMRYEDEEREERSVTVEKDRTIQVAFSYVQRPPAPEVFVLVEAGTFQMGSTGGDDDWKPAHRVTISRSFYICQYEVTQKQWREVMGTNPSQFKGDNLPVENVSWYDLVEYCNRLSRKEGLTPCYSVEEISATDRINNPIRFILVTGQQESTGSKVKRAIRCNFSANGYRLPTEAEWEYAARGGNKSRGYIYSGSNSAGDVGWYDDNSGGKTHLVGQKRPNELGLYDMSGNVYEWCWDWSGKYSSSSQTDPRGPSSGSDRVYRGGSWNDFTRPMRVNDRHGITPSVRHFALGFRPVRTAE